ncbi:hypothetical protein PPYR_05914 [Photinus pyralis]|uniref:RanBD1 domain-containing protein n=1 Tax=Photinus pyralis TaxID=7054 RepID=A0A1Y1MTF0_PHOPY|nr:nuclear pore complex protein Nup50-like [Photinus pyralis]XP_031341661.1 nuclear pore complex protein Nup50-like [Photinus pyralis]KAB0799432.1 hypothetical protein PPYR_07312 [Photinus pyralis]KAB0801560.1 hypothetical protein PPYR_05914 [Photinus pyralis]
MAGKRIATSDLNHTNWEQEDEPEEAGSFSKASEDILKNRVIKIAKRRNPIGSLASSDDEKKTTFANFGGFIKPSTTSNTQAFSFLANLQNKSEDHPKSNGLDGSKTCNKPTEKMSIPPVQSESENSGKPKEYYAKIKGLNQSVSKWIKQHVDTNPFLNLTPIFRDYEKYLEEIESLNMQCESNKTKETAKVFKAASCEKLPDASEKKTSLQFGATNSSTMTSNLFTFGKSNVESSRTGFIFDNTPKPFAMATEAQKEEANEEDEDNPPKVEFTPVVEEDHIYTVRCKVFVKKDEEFGDRGVGNLFLKPIPDSDKVQLIVRADTNLGNLLCNFILSKSIPTQRLGKKDVMLMCMPTPEHKPPPVPVLFRVKSSEQADELLKILDKHKK